MTTVPADGLMDGVPLISLYVYAVLLASANKRTYIGSHGVFYGFH
jgi:hypothetical protein